MIVSLNPNISNKKRQATNFGDVDAKTLQVYKESPTTAINNKLPLLSLKDAIDTVKHILTFETAPGRIKSLNRYLA